MIPKNKEPTTTKARNLIIPPTKVDGIMERVKGAINRVESNVYGESMMMAASGAPYVNPFQDNLHPQKKDDYLILWIS
jgi:hypothetical protein